MADRGEPPGPEPAVPAWREGVDADRRKRRRRGDERAGVRSLTLTAVVVAAGLNVILFVQTGSAWVGPGGIQGAIVSILDTFVPSAGPRAPAAPPGGTPAASPVVVTGAS